MKLNRLAWYAVACGLALMNAASAAGLPEQQTGADARASSATAPTPQVNADAALQRLRELMDQRLALMPDVARHKWRNGGKIDDLPRERIIIARFVAEAQALGLPAAWAERFFRAQIEAAKIVQRECFAAWSRAGAGPVGDPPDLATEIRPRLDALERPLMQALAAAWPVLADPAQRARIAKAPGTMQGAALSGAAAARALAPLMDVSGQE